MEIRIVGWLLFTDFLVFLHTSISWGLEPELAQYSVVGRKNTAFVKNIYRVLCNCVCVLKYEYLYCLFVINFYATQKSECVCFCTYMCVHLCVIECICCVFSFVCFSMQKGVCVYMCIHFYEYTDTQLCVFVKCAYVCIYYVYYVCVSEYANEIVCQLKIWIIYTKSCSLISTILHPFHLFLS